jgi:Golgi to ER traffic protein 4
VESTRCFSSLVDAYKASLERDSTLLQYVERIGALFFGLKQKPTSSSSNPLENLMNSFTAQMGHGSRGHQEQHLADLDLDVD